MSRDVEEGDEAFENHSGAKQDMLEVHMNSSDTYDRPQQRGKEDDGKARYPVVPALKKEVA